MPFVGQTSVRPSAPGPAVRSAPRLRRVDHETCQEQVYGQLRDAFMRGRFLPGDTLTLRGLACELGTSLTPIRETLRQLVAEQALEIVERRKVKVPIMTGQTLDELRRLRVILEGMLTEEASRRMVSSAREKLAALSRDMIIALERSDAKAYLAKNQAFHFEIYRASGSPIALRVVENLWLRIGPSFNFLFRQRSLLTLEESQDKIRESLVKHHEAIVDAMRNQRHANAREAMESDINSGMSFLGNVIGATEEWRKW